MGLSRSSARILCVGFVFLVVQLFANYKQALTTTTSFSSTRETALYIPNTKSNDTPNHDSSTTSKTAVMEDSLPSVAPSFTPSELPSELPSDVPVSFVNPSAAPPSKADLTVWTNYRGVWKVPMLVVRERSTNMFELLRVNFRFCFNEVDGKNTNRTKASCPPNYIPLGAEEASDPVLFRRDMPLIFIENHTIYTRIPKKRFDPETDILAVTYWSETFQSHVPLEQYRSSRQNQRRLKRSTCRGDTCPVKCPTSLGDGAYTNHPYVWDRNDYLCKTSDPNSLPTLHGYGGACKCETTCFTPEVGHPNSTWPWTDKTEYERFYPPTTTVTEKVMANRQNRIIHKSLKERIGHAANTARFQCHHRKPKKLPFPIFAEFKHFLFFIPKAKLVFCGIPKVGMSEWLKFFRFSYGAGDYLSLTHFKRDRKSFLMSSLSVDKALELLQDPTWTKAVFFRDPAERLLSAYLNKILGQGYTQTVFGIGDTNDEERYKLTFSEFVDLVTMENITMPKDPRGLHAFTDPHWKPQTMMCGLDNLLPQFDFVGKMSEDSIADHTRALLERVNFWDDYGAKYDDGIGLLEDTKSAQCFVPPPVRENNQGKNSSIVLGFNQRGVSGGYSHATGSRSKVEEYYTPELLEKVRKAYAMDYAIWDDLNGRPDNKPTTGRDLKFVQAYCDKERMSRDPSVSSNK